MSEDPIFTQAAEMVEAGALGFSEAGERLTDHQLADRAYGDVLARLVRAQGHEPSLKLEDVELFRLRSTAALLEQLRIRTS